MSEKKNTGTSGQRWSEEPASSTGGEGEELGDEVAVSSSSPLIHPLYHQQNLVKGDNVVGQNEDDTSHLPGISTRSTVAQEQEDCDTPPTDRTGTLKRPRDRDYYGDTGAGVTSRERLLPGISTRSTVAQEQEDCDKSPTYRTGTFKRPRDRDYYGDADAGVTSREGLLSALLTEELNEMEKERQHGAISATNIDHDESQKISSRGLDITSRRHTKDISSISSIISPQQGTTKHQHQHQHQQQPGTIPPHQRRNTQYISRLGAQVEATGIQHHQWPNIQEGSTIISRRGEHFPPPSGHYHRHHWDDIGSSRQEIIRQQIDVPNPESRREQFFPPPNYDLDHASALPIHPLVLPFQESSSLPDQDNSNETSRSEIESRLTHQSSSRNFETIQQYTHPVPTAISSATTTTRSRLLSGSTSMTSPLSSSSRSQVKPYYQRKIIALSTEHDEERLSQFLCFVRSKCVEVFMANDEDVASRRTSKKVVMGQVGIRCRFCAHIPHRERAGRSSSFPSSISRLYQSLTMMLREHFINCHMLPRQIKDQYFSLKEIVSQGAPESKKYWVESAQILGLVDTEEGIRFGRREISAHVPPYSLVAGGRHLSPPS